MAKERIDPVTGKRIIFTNAPAHLKTPEELRFYSHCGKINKSGINEASKQKARETKERNKYRTHRAKLDALRIMDIMIRLHRGDFG